MKINASGLEHYQKYVKSLKNGESPGLKNKDAAKTPAVKTDTVTISDDAAMRVSVARLATALAAEVDAPVSPARLEELRQAVQEGSYFVSSEELADAILRRGV